ncbi:hypothetical protein UFOVP181_331 [uncultured Caudovirales phage]|uniref:Gp5/Type VI secretion system Vgr protein OB-fold domain-containing protein n=1 Tax=uncultured Caudovirales phage TaxID=2100421 RepID=A0A6J7WLB9_9CAUD|nr:hypothetical protein UFOVP57_308 [uncultured Caudovirales phage]CAB5209134.1 hypothetical protein UFOVP181_331 [uncultured Caudovirales phage]
MSNDNIDYSSSESAQSSPGPFLARVVSHLVPSYMGVLEVELLRPVGNDQTAGQLHQVKMMSPFWGSTSVSFVGESADDYNNTQKSYGMWFVPPDVGNTVMVIFIDGDPKRGYWIGCIPDENMNFMVPGIAATEQVVEGGGRLPVAEYNKKINAQIPEATKVKKPKHPLANVLTTQGLIKDDIRGITTSSARRELPSAVFGISTPGPRDKASGAKTGKVGKSDSAIQTFVSRLGGTTFVMDDGDDKFIRKTAAGDGPPEYVSVEQGETGGKKDIPHNELVRIRTRTGHQILLHNSEDLIYIGNSKGTTWIELTSNGKIDIYAKDSISVHTEQDLNFTADRDINLTATRDINLSAGRNANMTATTNTNINSAHHYETAGKIDMNGPVAAKALKAGRIPLAEPWAGHENLDPAGCTPAKTAAVAAPKQPAPVKWKQYTTTTDTFKQEKPTNGNK